MKLLFSKIEKKADLTIRRLGQQLFSVKILFSHIQLLLHYF